MNCCERRRSARAPTSYRRSYPSSTRRIPASTSTCGSRPRAARSSSSARTRSGSLSSAASSLGQSSHAKPLVEDEIVLIGPAALAGGPAPGAGARGADVGVARGGSATRAAVEAARWQMGLHEVRRLELPSWEAVKRVVASGGGIAAISRIALDVELLAGTVAILDVPAVAPDAHDLARYCARGPTHPSRRPFRRAPARAAQRKPKLVSRRRPAGVRTKSWRA